LEYKGLRRGDIGLAIVRALYVSVHVSVVYKVFKTIVCTGVHMSTENSQMGVNDAIRTDI
jgi:hypothetical protein